MRKKSVKPTDEVSKHKLGWNLLHYIAKHNAVNCLENCLKTTFQENPKFYHKMLESKTIDEDTPLLIAFQFKSNKIIKLLLDLGGVDIYAMNIKKETAYQIAETNSNREGLQLLMKYELKIKEK